VVNMVLKGKIQDAKTISSVLWLDHITRNKARSKYIR